MKLFLLTCALPLALFGLGEGNSPRYQLTLVSAGGSGGTYWHYPLYRIDTFTGKTWALPDGVEHWVEIKEN
jgi:hypothetical protein